MFWPGVIAGTIIGFFLGVLVIGLCIASGRADLEMKFNVFRHKKIRKILRRELPNELS